MAAQLVSQVNGLLLIVSPPVDQITGEYRDDLAGIKVWVNDIPNFDPPISGSLVYEGPGLVITIPNLIPGQTYYVKYAFISSIDESVYDVSDVALSGAPRSGLGIEITLSNPVDLIPAAFDGTVSSFIGTGTVIEVFEGVESLIYDAIGTSAGTWSVTSVADPEITLPSGFIEIIEGKAVTKNIIGLSDDKATITFTATGRSLDGTSFTRTIVQTFSKVKQGLPGTSGSSTALVYAYKRVAVAPTDNPGSVTYTFSSNTITSPGMLANAWQKTIPNGTDPLYVTVATASSATDTDAIDAFEWSSPVLLTQNGANGLNTATVFLYARNNSSITAPALSTSGTATYTFSTRTLSGTIPSGWSTTIPVASSGTVIWVAQATASSNTNTDFIANTEWSTPQVLAQKGDTGLSGITITLSNESHTLPSTDTGTVLNYTGSGTTVQVYEGTTLLSAVSSITANSQFTIGTPTVSPAGSITVGSRSYSGTTATVGVHSAASTSADVITITYPISIRRSDSTTATINKVQTLTKAKSSRFAYLSASSQVFIVAKDLTVTPSSITLTATGQNVNGSPVFTVISGSATLTGTGTTRTLTYTELVTQSATVQITWDGIVDYITVGKVRDGEDGEDGERGNISISRQPATVPNTSSSVFRYYTRPMNRAPWTSGTSQFNPIFNEVYASYVDSFATEQVCTSVGLPNSVTNLKIGDTITISNFDVAPPPSLIYLADNPQGNIGNNTYSSWDINHIGQTYVLVVSTSNTSPGPQQQKVLYSTSPPDYSNSGNQTWEVATLDGVPYINSRFSTANLPITKIKDVLYRVVSDNVIVYTTNGIAWKSIYIPTSIANQYNLIGIKGLVASSTGILIYGGGFNANNELASFVLHTRDFSSYTVIFNQLMSVINLGIGGSPSIIYGSRSACFLSGKDTVLIGSEDGKILKITGDSPGVWTIINSTDNKLYSQRINNLASNPSASVIIATSSASGESSRQANLRISISYDSGSSWVEKTDFSDIFPLNRSTSYASKLEFINNKFHIILTDWNNSAIARYCRALVSDDGLFWSLGANFDGSVANVAPMGSLYSSVEPNLLIYTTATGRIVQSNVKEVFSLQRYIYPEKVSISGFWDGSKWSKQLNSILDGSNILDSSITNNSLSQGSVTNGNLAPLTLTADKISPNSLASISTFLLTGAVSAVLATGTALTRANSTLIGSITVVNDSNVAERLFVSGYGRSSASGSFSGQSQAFAVFDTSGTVYYSSGYTKSDEDSKTFGFTTSIPAFATLTFEVRAVKTSSYTLNYSLTANTVGVNN